MKSTGQPVGSLYGISINRAVLMTPEMEMCQTKASTHVVKPSLVNPNSQNLECGEMRNDDNWGALALNLHRGTEGVALVSGGAQPAQRGSPVRARHLG